MRTCLNLSLRSGAVALALIARPLAGQTGHEGHDHDAMAAGAEHAMSGSLDMTGHLELTPRRAATAADTARGAAILAALRPTLERYRDVRAAEADGFRMFAPQIKNQRVYHFTSRRWGFRAAFAFDPAKPTSLLYTRDARGEFHLVGAMYTAPARASLDDLDARVPLGLAQWHRHVNVCIPPFGHRERWLETRDGRMLFGPAGAITTRAACDAEGGHFLPHVFGWMVHVNALAEHAADVWRDEH
jgi:hypothetical protein